MRYINKEKKQLLIKVPIYKNITKTTVKTKHGRNKTKSNIKYIARIPNEVLIMLLENYKKYDPSSDDDADYIKNMLDQDKYYLLFSNCSGAVSLSIVTDADNVPDDAARMAIRKQKNSISYNYTVSKKFFKSLDGAGVKRYMLYIVDFCNVENDNLFVSVKLL